MARSNKRGKDWKWLAGAGILFLLTKLKALLPLLKFGKFGGTLITMATSVWFYTLIAPVEVAVGLVVMLFIHELGHVIAARRVGLPVSAPVFIPFLGALINMKRHPRDAATEAYMAFGGPLLGTIGASVCFWIGWRWNIPVLLVVANVGFFLNLINLLPIHPLDGGRIVVAVTRWLWLVGLVGGLAVIVYLKSVLFFIIWAMFAWELYKKFVGAKDHGKRLAAGGRAEVPLAPLLEAGIFIPGEEHRRELSFTTYSDLDGGQTVEVYWEGLGLSEKMPLPRQAIIYRVLAYRVAREPAENPQRLVVHYQIEYEIFENDRYYEVSPATRWKYGAAYLLLALWLGAMIYGVNELLGGHLSRDMYR